MTRARKLTARQIEMLRVIDDIKPEGWGELWTQWDCLSPGHSAFQMMNFRRLTDALKCRELIADDDDGILLTDAGRAAIAAHRGGGK